MPNFAGGSAYAMARDIGEGFQLVTERTFKGYTLSELDQLGFEMDRYLRDLRGESQGGDSTQEIQVRNRKIQRLNTALVVLRGYRAKSRR
jgi:hypothetical protein